MGKARKRAFLYVYVNNSNSWSYSFKYTVNYTFKIDKKIGILTCGSNVLYHTRILHCSKQKNQEHVKPTLKTRKKSLLSVLWN